MREIWNAVNLESLIHATGNGELPECNRGSWFCPVAESKDAKRLDNILSESGINTVYDLGAGDCRFAVAMDKRGYEVIAYESISDIADYGMSQLPENNVTVRNTDYYTDWDEIRHNRAAFVALGKLNRIPDGEHNGLAFDGMEIER